MNVLSTWRAWLTVAALTAGFGAVAVAASPPAIAATSITYCFEMYDRNGKLVEGWNVFDQLGMFQQLGVINMP